MNKKSNALAHITQKEHCFYWICKTALFLLNMQDCSVLTPAETYRDTWGHQYKLLQNHCRVDVRKYYFAERIVRQRNNLRAQESDLSSLCRFIKYLNSTDLSAYLLMNWTCNPVWTEMPASVFFYKPWHLVLKHSCYVLNCFLSDIVQCIRRVWLPILD